MVFSVVNILSVYDFSLIRLEKREQARSLILVIETSAIRGMSHKQGSGTVIQAFLYLCTVLA
jgi:hypothetical protein